MLLRFTDTDGLFTRCFETAVLGGVCPRNNKYLSFLIVGHSLYKEHSDKLRPNGNKRGNGNKRVDGKI